MVSTGEFLYTIEASIHSPPIFHVSVPNDLGMNWSNPTKSKQFIQFQKFLKQGPTYLSNLSFSVVTEMI